MALVLGALTSGVWGCAPQGEDETSESAWQLEGTFLILIVDYEDGSHQQRYELQLDDGEQYVDLVFDEAPRLEPNIRIGVSGSFDARGRFRVEDHAALSPSGPGTVTQHLIGADPYPVKNIAVLLVAPGGVTDSETVQSLQQKVFTNEDSTAAYYAEASYGIETLTGDVYGWFTVSANVLDDPDGDPDSQTFNRCHTNNLAQHARAAAQSSGVDLGQYGQIMYYFPRTDRCGWGGLAQLGRPLNPAPNSWYNGGSGCVVLAHELGHNYGLQHSGSHDCGATPLLEDTDQCSTSEYGDPFCPMGSGCWHFQAYQKAALGYLQACNLVDVRHDGSFAIEPMALPTNGIQTLRLQLGDSDDYLYLEYRQPIGFDANARTSQRSVYEGVLIRVAPYTGWTPSERPNNTRPNILDMTPGSQNRDHDDASLAVGQSYTTPDGAVTITVDAANEERAQVRIEFADGGTGETPTTCQDGSLPPVGGGDDGGGDDGGGDDGGGDDGGGDDGGGDSSGGEPLPTCFELPAWAPGTSAAAVHHLAQKYRCFAADLCDLDSTSIYEPGVGLAWSQAWTHEGECELLPPDPTGPGAGTGGAGAGMGGAGFPDPNAPGANADGLDPSRAGADADSVLVGRWSCAVSPARSGGGLPVGLSWGLAGWAAIYLRRRTQSSRPE